MVDDTSGTLGPKTRFKRVGLDPVVGRGRGAVRVDVVDVCRRQPGVGYGRRHRPHRPVPVRVGLGDVVGVGGGAVADQLGQDRGAPAEGELPLFEDESGRPLAQHETVPVDVEGPGGPLRLVVAGRERLHGGEAGYPDRGHGRLATAGTPRRRPGPDGWRRKRCRWREPTPNRP